MRARLFTVPRGATFPLPLFLPVYQPRERVFQLAAWEGDPAIEGIIVNSYFLYKQKDIRKRLTSELSLAEYIGFDGLLTTDSGAFQGFTRTLLLSNKKIVKFQDQIGSDVLAPLDMVTPPGDNRTVAEEKLRVTEKRIAEALPLAERGILAGVQQGGRFLDLRRRAVRWLMEQGVHYLAIGSLVPFFNKNHDMEFVGEVVSDARSAAGKDIPMHIYGAGDPCELPFMFAFGANIFDSASYGHFAAGGWYMTPYGALKDPGPIKAGEFRCSCPVCQSTELTIEEIFADKELLTRHNLWTICQTVRELREKYHEPDALNHRLEEILDIHQTWFPDSALRRSWETVHG